MNTSNTATDIYTQEKSFNAPQMTTPLDGNSVSIGNGFQADNFRAQKVGTAMDPLIMVDHYTMTTSTFDAHPHAGMSAVSLIFEDSKGRFHNRDSLGNDFDLLPGDLYWLSAGSGAVHDESPRENSRIHGLQVFVNVPQAQRFNAPSSLLVRKDDMPVIKNAEYQVKVVLGQSNNIIGVDSPNSMTILDGHISPNGNFSHTINSNRSVWVHAIKGELKVSVAGRVEKIEQGQAIAISNSTFGRDTNVTLTNPSKDIAHFALFDGERIQETYIQEGPFVMGSKKEIKNIQAAYAAGELGNI